MKLTPTDIFEGTDLKSIEYHDEDGNFVIQVMWDDQDPQDQEHQDNLRSWGKRMLAQLGHEVVS